MAAPANPNAARTLAIIGAASGLGAPHPGSAAAPDALQAGGLLQQLARAGTQPRWIDTLRPHALPLPAATMLQRLHTNGAFARRVADAVAALPTDCLPLILGGDHAIASGTWRGLGRRAGRAPGLLWIDAHLDSHTPASTHSGNIHGMPLAALLGAGDASLTGIRGPTLDPARVCVIGARAWEPEEARLLQQRGVRVITCDEVRRCGLATAFSSALAQVRAGGEGFGLSLDLDALDPQALPAVTCPEPDGLAPAELLAALAALSSCPDLLGVEIVEYRPDLDPERSSAQWIARFAATVGGGGVASPP